MSRLYTEEEQDIANTILYNTLQENPNWRAIANKFDVNYWRILARKNGREDYSNYDNYNKFLTSD